MTWPQYQRQSCTVNGNVIHLPRGPLEILSTLLIWRGHYVSPNTLIGSVWPDPDKEPGQPIGVVETYIATLRRILGKNAILNLHGWGWMIPLPKKERA